MSYFAHLGYFMTSGQSIVRDGVVANVGYHGLEWISVSCMDALSN